MMMWRLFKQGALYPNTRMTGCVVSVFLFILSVVGFAGVARADCEESPLAGLWKNARADIQELSRLEIETVCDRGHVLLRVRAYSKCLPRDCKWGRELAYPDRGGNFLVVFSTFSANRLLYFARVGDALHVTLNIDYRDAQRQAVQREVTLMRAH